MARSRAFPILAAVVSLTLVGAAPPHRFSPCLHGRFMGITQTLPDGTIVGEPDPHDWGCAGKGAHSDALLVGPGRGPALSGVPVPPPPTTVCMEPAAPNPAEAVTRLQFSLPESGHVSLAIVRQAQRLGYEPDASRVVRTVLDATLAAGIHAIYWDLTDDRGECLEPGLYRAVLVVGDQALCGDIEVR